MQEDAEVKLTASERVRVDLYLAPQAQQAPLVIFLHGHDGSKRAHANQAALVTSWGMHSMTVQAPAKGPWTANGQILRRLIDVIHRSPGSIDKRIDASRIIAVGHSFGAYSVTVAVAEGAPVLGAILLDPAGSGSELRAVLPRIRKPIMVLAADEDIDTPRNRDEFMELIPNRVAQLSIRGATHDDAQYPSEHALQNDGVDPETSEAAQLAFTSAIAASAFSLAATGTFDYAWASFARAFAEGRFFNERRKFLRSGRP